jgi:carbonic anhydrase/acetyltransferase-like protein (isoleucine patch superfamily)
MQRRRAILRLPPSRQCRSTRSATAVRPCRRTAPNASLIGDVRLGQDAGLWFGAVLRGDNEPIANISRD